MNLDIRGRRHEDWLDELRRQMERLGTPGGPGGGAVLAAVTVRVATYPTAPNVFYAVQPQRVGGPEVEGGVPAYEAGAGVFYALNLGTKVPPLGTRVDVYRVPNRFVFRYG